LSSGVGIKKALKTSAKKTGNERCQEAMRGVYEAVTGGEDITTGMKAQGDAFPPLMIDMVQVGEQTGALSEVLKSLAGHYENLIRMRRNFRQQIAWPVFQLVVAILVIALLLLILGEIAKSTGTQPLQILPGGLSGASGALTWLALNFGTFFGLFLLYRWTRHSLAGQQFLDPLLLKIPMLGHCLQSFAIARFSWAFALTQQSGMSIEPSLQSSFKATSNGAYIAAFPKVWAMMSRGESLGDSLAATGLFTEDYIQIVHAAEASGTVPEMLDHLSPQFEEQARLTLKTLTTGFAWAIWALVAMFIIFLIFSVASVYIGMLNSAAKGI
jgi:type IV pilus assembly protein PilC